MALERNDFRKVLLSAVTIREAIQAHIEIPRILEKISLHIGEITALRTKSESEDKPRRDLPGKINVKKISSVEVVFAGTPPEGDTFMSDNSIKNILLDEFIKENKEMFYNMGASFDFFELVSYNKTTYKTVFRFFNKEK